MELADGDGDSRVVAAPSGAMRAGAKVAGGKKDEWVKEAKQSAGENELEGWSKRPSVVQVARGPGRKER